MNFKPTLWKNVVSVVGGFVIGILYTATEYMCSEEYCPGPFEKLFSSGIGLILLGIGIIAIYLVWSFKQKK